MSLHPRSLLHLLPRPLIDLVVSAKQRLPFLARMIKPATAYFKSQESVITHGHAKGMRFNPGSANLTMALGTYEEDVQRLLAEAIRPGMTCYDVGANAGFFTVLMARLVGEEGRVYAFEPHPRLADLMRRNVASNALRHVTVVEKAVADRVSQEKLLVDRDLSCNRLATTGEAALESLLLETISLDGFVRDLDEPPPSVVKIDVEGAELRVLAGMEWILSNVSPIVFCEAHGTGRELLELFARHEYMCEWNGDPNRRGPPYPMLMARPHAP